MYMVMTIAEAIQADQQVVHHITAARVLTVSYTHLDVYKRQEVHPELVSEWSEENLPLTPYDITFGSNEKVW